MERPLVIGHRGAPEHAPEHTRRSYRLAASLGADAIETDAVPTRDGRLILRHENELTSTTDAARLGAPVTREIDGRAVTGIMAEDYDWSAIAGLRSRERLAALRPQSARFDGEEGIMTLAEGCELVDGLGVRFVIELKHAAYFRECGLALPALVLAELDRAGWRERTDVIYESFELSVLGEMRAIGARGTLVYLVDDAGTPADRLRDGARAADYASDLTPEGLDRLAGMVDGISVNVTLLEGERGRRLVRDAHERALTVYTWTLRSENAFLPSQHRAGAARRLADADIAQLASLDAHELDVLLARGDDRAAGAAALRERGDWRGWFSAVLGTGVDGAFFDAPELGRALVDERSVDSSAT